MNRKPSASPSAPRSGTLTATASASAAREPSATPAARACPVDLSITCPTCDTAMQPEHAHYRCLRCGYRDSCCM